MNIGELFPNVVKLWVDLVEAFYQTLIMVGVSFGFTIIIGLPLGVLLVATREQELFKNRVANGLLSAGTDLLRSTPTLILITAITPFTKIIMGTKIGIKGAIVPLVVASAPFLARQVEAVIMKMDKGVIESAKSMGTSPIGIILRVIIPESLSGLVNAMTITFVSLINFSAIAGAVGGGGLGDFALRYGYQQFKSDIMLVTVVILIALVTVVQIIGKSVSKQISHN